MKKRLIILGIIVLLAASALTAVLLYNRFTASKTRSFEVSTGDQITYALKTGTGIDMASDTNGNIVFTVDGISEAVFA
ncbi:MAG: hypothetical protein IKG80_01070, partial [Clostridia bacterium]|nr:hypothetical protein [Clostridia bacterium]